MNWTDIPHGDITAAEQRLWKGLGSSANTAVDQLKTDPEFVAHVVGFMRGKFHKPSEDQIRARAIMGGNYYGIEEMVQFLGTSPNAGGVEKLSAIPFSAEVLARSAETHILVPVFQSPWEALDRHAHKGILAFYEGRNMQGSSLWKAISVKPYWELIQKKPERRNLLSSRSTIGEMLDKTLFGTTDVSGLPYMATTRGLLCALLAEYLKYGSLHYLDEGPVCTGYRQWRNQNSGGITLVEMRKGRVYEEKQTYEMHVDSLDYREADQNKTCYFASAIPPGG